MNPQALDFVIRSITTALLAIIILGVALYEVVNGGPVDPQIGAFVGVVVGFYFGAHVSQNGSAARARRDQLITAEIAGTSPPPVETVRTSTNTETP